jgi:hypothetical protein
MHTADDRQNRTARPYFRKGTRVAGRFDSNAIRNTEPSRANLWSPDTREHLLLWTKDYLIVADVDHSGIRAKCPNRLIWFSATRLLLTANIPFTRAPGFVILWRSDSPIGPRCMAIIHLSLARARLRKLLASGFETCIVSSRGPYAFRESSTGNIKRSGSSPARGCRFSTLASTASLSSSDCRSKSCSPVTCRRPTRASC